ncbi:MAG: hypothetical protein GXP54_08770 [Deltaproteobacteria bacterium]|nr:hypothetical protein [Deltaproteobacteria bacterium]
MESLSRSCILAASACLMATTACANDDNALLLADSLLVTPCTGEQERLFEPFRFQADFLRWYNNGKTGFVEMRKGFRAATMSDAVYLEVTDIGKLKGILDETPDAVIELQSGLVRISLVLAAACPDGNQPMVAGPGLVTFDSFGNHMDGTISGSASFDLFDGRTIGDPDPTPLARNAFLTFSMTVRRGPPYQEFTNQAN